MGTGGEIMQGECELKHCNHLGPHEEGACWVITQKDLERRPDELKFCGCKTDGNIRRFDHPLMGFMTPRSNDLFITKKCTNCGDVVLMPVKQDVCTQCTISPQ